MADPEQALIEQAPDGTIMLGAVGERLTSGRDVYAIFERDQEWRLTSGGRALGTIPISNVVGIGTLLGFAGRRWRVEAVDDRAKVLAVAPHTSGRIPKFERLHAEPLHDRLAGEMRAVLLSEDMPPYLDARAAELLTEARRGEFVRIGAGQPARRHGRVASSRWTEPANAGSVRPNNALIAARPIDPPINRPAA